MTRKLTIFSARGVLAVAGLVGLALAVAGVALGEAVHPAFWAIPIVVLVNAALVGLAFVARRNAAARPEDENEADRLAAMLDAPTVQLPHIPPPVAPRRPAGMAVYPRFSVPAAWSTDDLTVLLPAQRANTNPNHELDDV